MSEEAKPVVVNMGATLKKVPTRKGCSPTCKYTKCQGHVGKPELKTGENTNGVRDQAS